MAGLEFKVFHGVGAVIAEVLSDTLFSVIGVPNDVRDIDFSNRDMRFPVNMTHTPNHVDRWEDVDDFVDDRGITQDGRELPPNTRPMLFPLAITSIGAGSSRIPARGALLGAVYLERKQFLLLQKSKLSGWPATQPPEVVTLLQLTSIAYSRKVDAGIPVNGRRSGKRYHGFSATVAGVEGNTVTVEITEIGEPHKVSFARDDEKAYDFDPPAEALDGQPSLAKRLEARQSGALFLELATAVKAGLSGIKLPIGEG